MSDLKRPARGLGAALAPLPALAAPVARATETFACPAAIARVDAQAEALTKPACKAAGRALAVLVQCGIKPSRRVAISMHERGLSLWGVPVFGAFDAERQVAHITDFRDCAALMAVTPGLCKLDPGEFYLSVIAHEVAHGVMQQRQQDRALDLLSAEYVAFVVQIAAMSEQMRQAFLAALPVPAGVQLAELKRETALRNPFLFGAMAYRHHVSDPTPCTTLQGIVAGTLIVPGGGE